jgi:tryptophan 2,3-dioxygenase
MQTAPVDTHTPLPLRDASRDASRNHYWSYHQLPTLLACKQPLTESADEDLFIAVHQVCELAFHQMRIDLRRALEAMRLAMTEPSDGIVDDPDEAVYFLERVVKLWRTVNVTMPVLADMRAFAQFRTSIGPTSGFQSAQFRHIEIMSGVARAYWQGGTRDAEGRLHVAETEFERQHGADIACWLAEHRGFNLAHGWAELRARLQAAPVALRTAALGRTAAWRAMLKAYDQAQTAFHRAHLQLALVQLRRVGAATGTGGTSFNEYLARYDTEVAPLFDGLDGEGAAPAPRPT